MSEMTSDSANTVHRLLMGRPAGRFQGNLRKHQIDLQCPGHHLQKPAGTGGALVVHGKIGDPAGVVHGEGLAVLAADVDDAAHGGGQKRAPAAWHEISVTARPAKSTLSRRSR